MTCSDRRAVGSTDSLRPGTDGDRGTTTSCRTRVTSSSCPDYRKGSGTDGIFSVPHQSRTPPNQPSDSRSQA